MYIQPNNSFNPLLQNSRSQGVGFGSFSFSSTFFSTAALGGLNNACGCYPRNPALNTLGSLFNCIALLRCFEGIFGGGFGCGPMPQPPSSGWCGTPSPQPPQPPCPPPPPALQQKKMWDVFFDAKSGTKTKQRSPIVLDLNGNGKADITGSNIKGNGKLEGRTVKGFDLDPQNRQWSTKSLMRRPGGGAPALGDDVTAKVFDKNGKLVKTLSAKQLKALQANKTAWNKDGGDMGLKLGAGMRAEFRDGKGQLVSELKRDGTNKNQLLYFWGNKNENEWTKAWDKKKGGDGLLVWDRDGDGKITSGKELFGHVDASGKNTFKNGYEKLAHYFDKNKDGVVNGAELRGLKIWEDRNGDGITQKGELVSLAKHGVRELNTSFNESDMSSSYGVRTPGQPVAAPSTPSLPNMPPMSEVPSTPPMSSQPAMEQTWQIFQLIMVMRQMTVFGYGLN